MDIVNGLGVDRVILKVGDLVKHVPILEESSGLNNVLLEDWGWLPDFEYGLIMDVQENLFLVYHFSSLGIDICWYPNGQLSRVTN